jgi:hypothetical protein
LDRQKTGFYGAYRYVLRGFHACQVDENFEALQMLGL